MSEIIIPLMAPILLIAAFMWLIVLITIFGKDWYQL